MVIYERLCQWPSFVSYCMLSLSTKGHFSRTFLLCLWRSKGQICKRGMFYIVSVVSSSPKSGVAIISVSVRFYTKNNIKNRYEILIFGMTWLTFVSDGYMYVTLCITSRVHKV